MLPVLLETTTSDLRAELATVVLLLLVAVVRAVISHLEAKRARAEAKSDAEKAAAAEAERIAAERATAAQKAALEAVVVGVEAFKRRLDEKAAKQTSNAIRTVAEARGVEGIVHETVVRLTKPKDSPTVFREAVKPDPSDPFPRRDSGRGRWSLLVGAAVIAFAVGSLCISGCVNAAIHDAAKTARVTCQQLHDTSEPMDAWLRRRAGEPKGDGTVWEVAELENAWARKWGALEAALEQIEEASR